MLAIAWDQIVQLICIEKEEGQQAKLVTNGYYCTEGIIDQVYFSAESVIVIQVNKSELKVLDTTKFRSGDVSELGKVTYVGVDVTDRKNFKAAINATSCSEI